jgi:hypothetical protein
MLKTWFVRTAETDPSCRRSSNVAKHIRPTDTASDREQVGLHGQAVALEAAPLANEQSPQSGKQIKRIRTMAAKVEPSSKASPQISPLLVQRSEQTTRKFRVVKRTAIALWALCALALPGFLPFISADAHPRLTLVIFVLFCLSWLAFYCGLYAAILDNARAGSPQAKFTKNVGIPFLMSLLGHRDP